MRTRTKRPAAKPLPLPKLSKHKGSLEVLVITDASADSVIVHFAGRDLSRISLTGRSAALSFAEVIKQHALQLRYEEDEDEDDDSR